jgi:hypothetical protein
MRRNEKGRKNGRKQRKEEAGVGKKQSKTEKQRGVVIDY